MNRGSSKIAELVKLASAGCPCTSRVQKQLALVSSCKSPIAMNYYCLRYEL